MTGLQGNYQVWLEDGGILVVNLIGTIDSKMAFDVERSIKTFLKAIPDIKSIIFSMIGASSLSSKAINILTDYNQEKKTIYFKIPELVKKQIYNPEVLKEFEKREINKNNIQELVRAIQKSYSEDENDVGIQR